MQDPCPGGLMTKTTKAIVLKHSQLFMVLNNLYQSLLTYYIIQPLAKILSSLAIVRMPCPPLSAGREGLTSNQIFKKGDLYRTSFFRGGCWEKGGDFFQGGWGGGGWGGGAIFR